MESKVMKQEEIACKTHQSQAYFNRFLLNLYDFVVYRIVSKFIWRMPETRLIEHYKKHLSDNHLEVGVGTGYLLDKTKDNIKQLSLMDLSEPCLMKTAKRLKSFNPSVYRQNILDKPQLDNKFDSISVNYVMHCVTGDFKQKGIAFNHLKSLLNEDGVLFGTTVLKTPNSSFLAKFAMHVLNSIGLFNNQNDRIDELHASLQHYFKHVDIKTVSSVAIFLASDKPLAAEG